MIDYIFAAVFSDRNAPLQKKYRLLTNPFHFS
jgi:hypothetical protein